MFFQYGFCYIDLDEQVLADVKSVVQGASYASTEKDGTGDVIWPRDADGKEIRPVEYERLVEHIISHVSDLFGSQMTCTSIVTWTGSELLGWHHHMTDGEVEDYHVLLYLGDDEWHPEAGGLLELKNALIPETIFSVVPKYGTAVLLNNTNANFLHRVTAYKPLSRRIVFQMSLATNF